MSIKTFQRSRISAALRSLLRAAVGRDPSQDEITGRVAAYLSAPLTRGLGPSDLTPSAMPLFAAADYAPTSENDPLGGADGRDISRGWAALVEDYDTVDEALTEFERRLSVSQNLIRKQGTALSADADSLTLAASAAESQLKTLFFGGSGGAASAGRGRSVWKNAAADGLQPQQSTAVILSSGLALLPTQGQALGQISGGSLASLRLLSSSDSTLLSSSELRAFIEQPLSNASAWSFRSIATAPAALTFSLSGKGSVGALEITASPGVTIGALTQNSVAVPFHSLRTAGTLWLIPNTPLAPGVALTMTLTAVASSTNVATGSISSIKAHVFSFDSGGVLVWGPFAQLTNNNLFSVTLDRLDSASPLGSQILMQVSTVSPDGPWLNFPDIGKPLVLSASGSADVELLPGQAQPDLLSQGFYQFPFTQASSLVGAEFTAGLGQAKAEAYYFNWSSLGEVAHDVKPTDWTNPQGTPRTVAMGAGPTFRGDLLLQAFAPTEFIASGSCIGRYRDTRGVDATYIALRDGVNNPVLQPGYNYRFSFGLYTVGNSYLSDIPIGIFNPNGSAGVYALPILLELNGQQVYRTAQTFQDFNELSSVPAGYGTTPTDYTTGTGSRSYQGNGAAWPPYCGRVSLALSPGWNTLSISFYIPIGNPLIDANLAANAAIVFGPSLFNDRSALYQTTGIETVRGWTAPWTQLSEFDLRTNTPLGITNAWAWLVSPDTRTLQAILLNHNPAYSETGYPSLDGIITGQPRTHHLRYLPVPVAADPLIPGQETQMSRLWVKAQLSSSSPETGPFLSAFEISAN